MTCADGETLEAVNDGFSAGGDRVTVMGLQRPVSGSKLQRETSGTRLGRRSSANQQLAAATAAAQLRTTAELEQLVPPPPAPMLAMQRATAAMAALLKGAEGPDDGSSRVERVRAALDAMFNRGGIRAVARTLEQFPSPKPHQVRIQSLMHCRKQLRQDSPSSPDSHLYHNFCFILPIYCIASHRVTHIRHWCFCYR